MNDPAAVLGPGTLDGRTVVVTGAGSGIGATVARRAIELGATVVGLGRTEESLVRSAASSADPDRFRIRVCDVRDRELLEATIADIGATVGIDAVVANAGGQFFAPAQDITPNGWRSVLELNLDAVFWLCRAARPYLAASQGSVVCLSLTGVERGGRGMAHSIAARAGVLGLVRTLALEWAADRIRLNCLGPGTVATERLSSSADPEVLDSLLAATPLGRFTEPAEVAEMVAFLISPAGAMITGQLLQVDGGASLGPGLHMLPSDGNGVDRPW